MGGETRKVGKTGNHVDQRATKRSKGSMASAEQKITHSWKSWMSRQRDKEEIETIQCCSFDFIPFVLSILEL